MGWMVEGPLLAMVALAAGALVAGFTVAGILFLCWVEHCFERHIMSRARVWRRVIDNRDEWEKGPHG